MTDPEAPKKLKNRRTGEELSRGEEKAVLWLCRYCGEPRDARVNWDCFSCTIQDVAAVFFSKYADDRVLTLIKLLRSDAAEAANVYFKVFDHSARNRAKTSIQWRTVVKNSYANLQRGTGNYGGEGWLTQVFVHGGRYVGQTRLEYSTGRIWPSLSEEIVGLARCFRFDSPMICTHGLKQGLRKIIQRCQI